MNNKELVKKLREVKVLGEQNEQQLERGIDKNAKIRKILEEYYEKDTEKVESAMANIKDMLDNVSRKKINDKASSKENYEQAVMKAYGNDTVKNLLLGLIPEGESSIKSLIEKTIKHVNKLKWKEITSEIDDLLLSKIPNVKEEKPIWLPALIVYLVKLNNRIKRINEFGNGQNISISEARSAPLILANEARSGSVSSDEDEPFAEDVLEDCNENVKGDYTGIKKELESTKSKINEATDLDSLAPCLSKLSEIAKRIVDLTDEKNGRYRLTKLVASYANSAIQSAGFNTAELGNISGYMSTISKNKFSNTKEIGNLEGLLENYEKKITSSEFLFPKLRKNFAAVSNECLNKATALRAEPIEKSPSPKDDAIDDVVNTLSKRLDEVANSLQQSTKISDISESLAELAQIASDIRNTTHVEKDHTSIGTAVRDVGQSIAYWMGYDPNTLTGISNGLFSLSTFVSQLKNKNSDGSKIANLGSKITGMLESLQEYAGKVITSSTKSFVELRKKFIGTVMGCIGMVTGIVQGLTSEIIEPKFVKNLLEKSNKAVDSYSLEHQSAISQISYNSSVLGEKDAETCANVITNAIFGEEKSSIRSDIVTTAEKAAEKSNIVIRTAVGFFGDKIAPSKNKKRNTFKKNILESFKKFSLEKDSTEKINILGNIKKQIANEAASQFGYNIDKEGRLVIGYDISKGISLQEYSKLIANSDRAVAAAAICKKFKSWITDPLLNIQTNLEIEILKAKRNLMQLNMLMVNKFGTENVETLNGFNGEPVTFQKIEGFNLEKLQNFNKAFESKYSDLQKSLNLKKYNAGWFLYANIDATVKAAWGNFYEKINSIFPCVKCNEYSEEKIKELDEQIEALEGI